MLSSLMLALPQVVVLGHPSTGFHALNCDVCSDKAWNVLSPANASSSCRLGKGTGCALAQHDDGCAAQPSCDEAGFLYVCCCFRDRRTTGRGCQCATFGAPCGKGRLVEALATSLA